MSVSDKAGGASDKSNLYYNAAYYEGAGGLQLSDSGPNAAKGGDFIPLGKDKAAIMAPLSEKKGSSGGFVPGNSPHNPKAFSGRFGEYKPHTPQMRMMADAHPKTKTNPAMPDPVQIEGRGVARNDKGKIEPNYGYKEPGQKFLMVKNQNGKDMPFKISATRGGEYDTPINVGKTTYYMKSEDKTNLQFAQHIATKNGKAPSLRVA